MLENTSRSAILRRILRRIQKYWAAVIFSLLLAVLSVACSLAIPVLVGAAVDAMLGEGMVDFKTVGNLLVAIGVCVSW